MKNRFYQVLGMAIIGLMLTVSPTFATTIVGGIAFDDNAFADTVLASYGTWTLVSAPNLQAALVGPDLTGYAYNINSPTSYVKMGF